jgi:hypothetical protein
VTGGPRRLAAAIACAALFATAVPARADDALAPPWLRAPLAPGPIAGTVAVDDRHVWWAIDGVLPLDLLPRSGSPALLRGAPRLGLGLSIAGDDRGRAGKLGYTARLDRRAPRSGEWLGVANGGGRDPGARLRLGAGLWHSFAPVQVDAGVVTSLIPTLGQELAHWQVTRITRDTLRTIDTTAFRAVDRTELHTSVQSALRWQFGRVEVAALGGLLLRGTTAPQRWAQATVDLRATRQLMVFAALGQRPASTRAFDPYAGSRTMLGVRLAPLSAREGIVPRAAVAHVVAWTAHARPQGRTLLRVRCAAATRVELAGDFTDWTPVTLEPLGGSWWKCELTIAAGLHQVQVRVDGGAWQPPPGLPTTAGDFAGTAGVLVIP